MMTAVLRRVAYRYVNAYKIEHPMCKRSNIFESEDVDHDPEFVKVSRSAFERMTPKDIEEALRSINFFSTKSYELSENNPGRRYVEQIH